VCLNKLTAEDNPLTNNKQNQSWIFQFKWWYYSNDFGRQPWGIWGWKTQGFVENSTWIRWGRNVKVIWQGQNKAWQCRKIYSSIDWSAKVRKNWERIYFLQFDIIKNVSVIVFELKVCFSKQNLMQIWASWNPQ